MKNIQLNKTIYLKLTEFSHHAFPVLRINVELAMMPQRYWLYKNY